ncbi:hypothetical protein PLANPX_5288 [Lacipirellula parvula]|uniref:Uncharacterized protein n=1 Tax=Lacipirellula parvula TaxID=2650471 RepID=A0A5K7XLV3_9BACT|nr:hypothetical protein PLANPX_5288 [Lacipirellula parvula]
MSDRFKSLHPDPSQTEIARLAAEIRAGWSQGKERSRASAEPVGAPVKTISVGRTSGKPMP